MSDQAIATAADYADAMITARRAKNLIVLLLLLMLLCQMTLFFLIRYNIISIAKSTAAVAATMPASVANWPDVLQLISGGCLFLALVLTIVLCFVLLLIVNIMLVGRLIGVARLTSAYIWCMLLLFLLFPWQAFMNNVPELNPSVATWKLPGVLYTWNEVSQGAKFPSDFSQGAMLKWARFVVWPLVALIILLAVHAKSNRGMRQALGEDDAALPGDSND